MDFLNDLKSRVEFQGVDVIDRLRNRKAYTHEKATKRSDQSYDASVIRKKINEETGLIEDYKFFFKLLMSPKKLTQDINLNTFSTSFDNELEIGEIVTCYGRNEKEQDTDWIMLYRRNTESAYIFLEGKKVNISVKLPSGKVIRGCSRTPVETTTPRLSKNDLIFEEMNSTILCTFPMVSKDELAFFERNKIVSVNGDNYKVVARDILVTEGKTFEVTLKEYYNEVTPEITEKQEEISDGEQIKDPYINGTFNIYCYDLEEYEIINLTGGSWEVSDPKKVKIIEQNDKKCKIEIVYGRPFEFSIGYRTNNSFYVQKIIVKSI